ncbi:hypothetical protein CCHR01_04223 [Colletotrichum chrysophilum]|uniref:Uncharacterized protein n=1 Tax=Colletotrichum chrysophilum TaxID=1836956 RepID=A0AAD9ARI0_9PEZI|nr:hypothetical protein CCHR01_04223 [Colletotrichum chrysophilum]
MPDANGAYSALIVLGLGPVLPPAFAGDGHLQDATMGFGLALSGAVPRSSEHLIFSTGAGLKDNVFD